MLHKITISNGWPTNPSSPRAVGDSLTSFRGTRPGKGVVTQPVGDDIGEPGANWCGKTVGGRGAGPTVGVNNKTRGIRTWSRRTRFLHRQDVLMVASVDDSVHFDQVQTWLLGRAVNVSQSCMAFVGLQTNHLSTCKRFKWLAGLVEEPLLHVPFKL